MSQPALMPLQESYYLRYPVAVRTEQLESAQALKARLDALKISLQPLQL